VAVRDLGGEHRSAMLALMEAHYHGVDAAGFAADLDEKDEAVLLERRGQLVGFSTLLRIDAAVAGRPVSAIFSGDTIVRPDAQGYAVLARAWSRHVFARAAEIRRLEPGRAVYWLLISAGYKTYRYLPLFFQRYLPAPGATPEPFAATVVATLAGARYGPRYLADRGIVRLERPTPLRSGIADVTEARERDPHVAFFLQANPGHAEGDELVCLAPLDPSAVTPAGRRMLGLGRTHVRVETGRPTADDAERGRA
jgi:hypothetical protein